MWFQVKLPLSCDRNTRMQLEAKMKREALKVQGVCFLSCLKYTPGLDFFTYCYSPFFVTGKNIYRSIILLAVLTRNDRIYGTFDL